MDLHSRPWQRRASAVTHDSDDPTAETLVAPWLVAAANHATTPRLVVAWWLDEPERAGQSLLVDRECIFGRLDAPEAAVLERRRPGGIVDPAPRLSTPAFSRRQLELAPGLGADPVIRVRNVGKRGIRHNGAPAAECTLHPGDVLHIDDVGILVADPWPSALDSATGARAFDFPFGVPDPDGIVGETAAAWQLRLHLADLAAAGRHTLVLGESGVGKELAARALHRLSRRGGPLVARSAATLPESLVEVELFGSMRGFPDARSPDRPGLVGLANGGTLFLDEIGELPEALQVRLLRVLDSGGEYQRLGESTTRSSRFAFVGATNRDPAALKHDLAARLPAQVVIPPLRERRADIPLLWRELMRREAEATPARILPFCQDRDPRRPNLDPWLAEALLLHPHPVNTRGLLKLLLGAVQASDGTHLRLTPAVQEALGIDVPDAVEGDPGDPLRHQVEAVLRAHGFNVTAAAQQLGMSRFRVSRLMEKLGIERPSP
jgi:transcriptional regulator with AAA-type ATPase domain